MKDVPYREAVGCLLYIAITVRPDIAWAVTNVARHCNNPGPRHWDAVMRIMRYLRGTANCGITFSRRPDGDQLSAYCDSDWGEEFQTRRSTSGMVTFLAGGPINWSSELQRKVATSTAHAESNALLLTVQDIIWHRDLLSEIGYTQKGPSPIFEDNQAVIAQVSNPGTKKSQKHYLIQLAYLREQYGQSYEVQYIESGRNIADLFTKKSTTTAHFSELFPALMGCDP